MEAPFPFSQQFIVGEDYTLVTGPGVIKSNLQTMTYKAYAYLADLKLFPATNITVSGGGTYTAPQAALIDFLSIEDDESYIVIKDVPFTTVYTQVPSSPGPFEYSINPTTGVFTFNIGEAGNTLNLKFYYLERH